MRADDLRRWIVEKRQTADREQRELRQAPPGRAWAIQSALALIALGDRFPAGPSAADERDVEQVRARWARLRAFYGKP